MERYHGWRSDRWFIGYPRRYLCRLQASHVWRLHPFPDRGCIAAFHGFADAQLDDDAAADARRDEAAIDADGFVGWRKPLGSCL